MKLDPVLNKAIRLARSRNFEGAFKVMESEVSRYSGSFRFYYLFAVICLYSGDRGGAIVYFRLAREIKMRDPKVMLGLAALYMHRKETGKAVDYYLDVLEMEPKNSIAKKGLAVIRKYSDSDSFSEWLESGKIPALYPPIPSAGFTPRMIVTGCAATAAALILLFGILISTRVVPNPFKRAGTRPVAEFHLSREERIAPVQLGGIYRYILTRDQTVEIYDRALSLFTSYRDEAAKINLNRILESNASDVIKNKARLLMDFMEVPGFDNFKRGDNVSISDVILEPVLYRDVHVIWRGMATNVETHESTTSFDFLVGYDTRRTLEGIVNVVFDSAVAVNTERPLEVLGKIIPLGSHEESIMLEGVALHQSGRLTE
ncbi:MAG: tetratricopeptide repeat protein [Treponema sp.]|nr:tetratricopeptide repeat protein [Treponema sp.]